VSDPGLRRTLSAAGPARASDFGVDRMVRGTQAVYDAVLTRGL